MQCHVGARVSRASLARREGARGASSWAGHMPASGVNRNIRNDLRHQFRHNLNIKSMYQIFLDRSCEECFQSFGPLVIRDQRECSKSEDIERKSQWARRFDDRCGSAPIGGGLPFLRLRSRNFHSLSAGTRRVVDGWSITLTGGAICLLVEPRPREHGIRCRSWNPLARFHLQHSTRFRGCLSWNSGVASRTG